MGELYGSLMRIFVVIEGAKVALGVVLTVVVGVGLVVVIRRWRGGG